MADDFVKVYRGFWAGTIAEESLPTRVVFLACLSLCDESGDFTGTPKFISKFASVELDDTIEALARLQEPDPGSTTQTEEGRRLLLMGPNRWKVVNYALYRGKNRADYMREYMRQRRQRLTSSAQSEGETANVLTATANGKHVSTKEKKGKERSPQTPRGADVRDRTEFRKDPIKGIDFEEEVHRNDQGDCVLCRTVPWSGEPFDEKAWRLARVDQGFSTNPMKKTVSSADNKRVR